MNKFLKFFVAVAFVLSLAIVPALARDNNFWVRIVDVEGNEITTGLTFTIYTAGSTTQATIYDDANRGSMSNAFDPGTDGVAKWWMAASTCDILVTDGMTYMKKTTLTVTDHIISMPLEDIELREAQIDLPIGSWYIVYDTNNDTVMDAVQRITGENFTVAGTLADGASAPNYDVQNYIGCIVWADGEESEIEMSFRVPANYKSGGGFRVWANTTLGSAGTEGEVGLDYSYYQNTDSATADTESTDETVVKVSSQFDGTADSENEYGLSIADTLTAGDLITLRLWRDDVTYVGAGALEVYHITFYYDKKL